MKQVLLILLFGVATMAMVQAQNEFHRTYSTNEDDHVVFDAVGSDGGNTYSVAGVRGDDSEQRFESLLVTSFDQKGTINYSTTLYSEDSTAFVGRASITRGLDGKLYVAGTVDRGEDNVLLYVLEDVALAGIVELTSFAVETESGQAEINRLVAAPDSTVLLATQINEEGQVALMKIDSTASVVWSQVIDSNDADLEDVTALDIRPDSLATLSGRSGAQAWQLHIDSMGVTTFGSVLSSEDGRSLTILDHLEVNDTITCVVGAISTDSSSYQGFVALVDQVDSVLWAAETNYGAQMSDAVFYHVDAQQTTLRVFGEVVGPTDAVFVLDLDLDSGQQEEHYVIDSASVFATPLPSGGLISRGNGYAYVGRTDRNNGSQHNFIRLNEDISTGCSGTSPDQVLQPLTLDIDTFLTTSTIAGTIVTVSTQGVAYQGYTNPVLSLADTTVCANLPFEKLFDATLEAATAYQWTLPDGSMRSDSAIIGTEVGEYIVEVTMGADVCYTICDTVNINEYQEPQVTIGLNTDGQCDIPPSNGLAVLGNVQAVPFEIVWEDGSTDPTRQVTAAGMYSVTVTDACMITASASATVAFPPPLPESISFQDPGDYCEGDDDLQLLLIDQDGEVVGEEYIIQIGGRAAPNPLIVPNASICDSLYVGQVTTDCGTRTAEIEIVTCSCFRWPLLFFPDSNESVAEGMLDNKSFGPVSKCDDIQDFEMHVYNRWGNEVFEGFDHETGWNGNFDDDPAPQGVYSWWATYSLNGEEIVDRGNVTLVR